MRHSMKMLYYVVPIVRYSHVCLDGVGRLVTVRLLKVSFGASVCPGRSRPGPMTPELGFSLSFGTLLTLVSSLYWYKRKFFWYHRRHTTCLPFPCSCSNSLLCFGNGKRNISYYHRIGSLHHHLHLSSPT